MTTQETIEIFEKFVIGNYTRSPVVLVRGEGSYVWDADGKKYLDLFPGWGVNGLGHCHPKVVAAIREQAAKLIHIANNFYSLPQGKLAELISKNSFGGKCFFCNSGAESVEAAIKLARIASAPGKFKIITMENSFHGRTLAAITATGQAKYHKGFEPLPAGFTYVPFNDLAAVSAAVDDETCAIMLEVIQGEGGINIAKRDYLQGLRDLCSSGGLFLIVDEVQTGMGRTGEYFAYKHFGVEPDIMTLAKALGGGMAIGAIVAKPEIAERLVPGSHASTFGGNPLAAAAACAVFSAIEEESLLENARHLGEYALTRLKETAAKYEFVKEARGVGLMLGMELAIPGEKIVKQCMERGLLINCTQERILRLMPPITVKKEELDQGLEILEGVLKEVKE
ncbi:MAG: acetylornithine aminotransferase [Planctomycetes bacterium DG_23]|nr:MAG: acetylornithine aminotransferase [Planctomycetes bacterium DG_23]